MGKTSDALQKRYRNNTRVDPGSVTHFLCYYCGKSSSDRVEYQLHMLKIHEVMSQSYQLWSDHTMDSLGLRWSHQARGGSGEGGVGGGGGREDTPISMPASPIPRDRKLKNSEEDDEDYVYEEEETPPSSSTIPQRRRDRPRKSEKLRKIQERKRLEEKRRLEGEGEGILENQKTTEEMGKRKERRKTVEPMESSILPSSSTTETTKRKRRRTDGGGGGGTRWKDLKSMDGGDDDPDVAAMVTKILVESKKKEASSLDVEEVELTVENKDRRPFDYSIKATKYCKVCKKGLHYTFETLFEHYQDHHHAVLKSFHYYGYIGKRLIGKKNVLERDFCQRCSIKFQRPRDYFSHMIRNHIQESVKCQLDFEMADNADVEARMLFRDRIITLGYNFKFGESSGRTTPYNDAPPPLDPSTDSFGEPSDVPTTSSGIQMIKKEEPMEVEEKGEEEERRLDGGGANVVVKNEPISEDN